MHVAVEPGKRFPEQAEVMENAVEPKGETRCLQSAGTGKRTRRNGLKQLRFHTLNPEVE